MKIISVNVGRPREVDWDGESVMTGIFKAPVDGPVAVRTLNLEGDGQADLMAHGGVSKAVYGYPVEHYAFWRQELPEMDFDWGVFGENLTIEGVELEQLQIGDRLRVGSALLQVTEPRLPCYKLGLRFGRSDMVKRFLVSRRTGSYFSVVEEGVVQAGDRMTFEARPSHGLTIADITRLYAFERDDWATMERVVALEDLSASWRNYFAARLER